MNCRFLPFAACIWLSQTFSPCQEPPPCKIKALVLQADGAVAENIPPQAWTLKVDGKSVAVQSVTPPSEVTKRPVKWVFVLMPVRDPRFRKLTLRSIATFMKTLPPSDSVLLVVQDGKGLQSLTPGFTQRPSLWVKALERAMTDFQAGLHQNVTAFSVPVSPTQEPQEDRNPLLAFLEKIEKSELSRQLADTRSSRNFKEDYVDLPNGMARVTGSRYERLRGWTRTAVETLKSLDTLAQALGREPGEKQVVLFSRNELDDLGSPLWTRNQLELDVSNMSSTTRLALLRTSNSFTGAGLTLHLISGSGLGYAGALGETAHATGGFAAFFQPTLPERLVSTLETWVNRYELSFQLPAGLNRPAKIEVEIAGKNLRLFAPTAL